PQGGSTITQQIVKNLLVGEDLTYERKIREMIVASRVEQTLSKAEILELYLNSVYLGRGSWGIEMAARGYFGKPAKELTFEAGASLFRQAGEGPHVGGGAAPGGPDQGPDLLQPRRAAGAGAGAAGLCPKPPEGGGSVRHRAPWGGIAPAAGAGSL